MDFDWNQLTPWVPYFILLFLIFLIIAGIGMTIESINSSRADALKAKQREKEWNDLSKP